MSWKTKGIDDARSGKKYDEPKRDLIDRVAGFTAENEKQWKRDYSDGYNVGTSQRVADSNKNKK